MARKKRKTSAASTTSIAAAGPSTALAHIRSQLGATPAHLARPDEAVVLCRQEKKWSCGYGCLQTLINALLHAGVPFEQALASAGLAEAGAAVDVRGLQAVIDRSWHRGFDPEGARQMREALRGTAFVGCRGKRAWIGCAEDCVALRSAGIRANTAGFCHKRHGVTELEEAQKLVAHLARYFADEGSPSWGADILPPALLCFGGHNYVVVGVARDSLVLLDPKWREPKLDLASAADLKRRASQFECLTVRPGVSAGELPKKLGLLA